MRRTSVKWAISGLRAFDEDNHMFGEGCSDLEFRNLELWSGLPSEDILANPNLFLRRFARITRPAWQERDPEHVEYDRLRTGTATRYARRINFLIKSRRGIRQRECLTCQSEHNRSKYPAWVAILRSLHNCCLPIILPVLRRLD